MAVAETAKGTIRIEPTHTERRDTWWVGPVITVVVLSLFVLYTTWAMVFGADHYYAQPYISPFYSPCFATSCPKEALPYVTWWFSPAYLIFYIPLAFRATCYYYRKAYYRSFFWAPPSCAVPDAPKRYSGETRFPLIIQNIHRYAFWPALIVVGFLWGDAFKGFHFAAGWGVGLGSIILLLNAILLSLYSFTCHSFRHMVGGYLDRLSLHPFRYQLWRIVTAGNERHALFAWISLVFVAWTDIYVRLVSAGVILDPHWVA